MKSWWSLESSENNFRGQNPLDWNDTCIIGNFLELKCLKWARMTHLNTSNTSYGQKKGQKSNWQFDSRPLKVMNHPYFLAWRCRVTYLWKDLDERYNLALNLISIGGLHTKLWAPKVTWVLVLGILRLPLGSPGTKWHLGAGPMAMHIVYYKGEGGGFPKFGLWWVLWIWGCSWFVLTSKMFQLCTNQLVVWFMQVCVSNWQLSLFLVPILKLQHAHVPPKCYKPMSMPQLLILPLFSP
jgi:hypothetical protein